MSARLAALLVVGALILLAVGAIVIADRVACKSDDNERTAEEA